MQAVVLMAGKGTRWAKDFSGPKQLMPLKGKPITEHTLDRLPAVVGEFIFVVGGPHEAAIRQHFGGAYGGRPITYVVQAEQRGLAHAFRTAKERLHGRWLGLVGDDIFGPRGLQALVEHELAALAARVPNPQKFGVLVTDAQRYLVRAVEKPVEFVSDLVWTGAMVMDERFFAVTTQPSARGEYETPDVWTAMIQELGAKIKVVEAELWLPMNDKAQLKEAERLLAAA